MEKHEQKAHALFIEGFNCAQSVFAAFADVTGVEKKLALRIAAPFGGGIGRMREVCGAVSGMLMTLGALYGYDQLDDAQARPQHYAQVQALVQKFTAQHQCLLCRELLQKQKEQQTFSEERSNDPCGDYVTTAARLVDAFIKENPLD